ncbi:MAG: toll/interleukin-1 receptor domain-containing protein [Hyphomonadaceae bacterium]
MTVFVLHAAADQAAAESLQTFLERRGLFVERATGERPFRPLQQADALVVLWSKDGPFDPYRLSIEKRALDAWADGQLIFVKLDHQFAPIGLRDLPFVDASFEQQRELVAWAEIAKRAASIRTPPQTQVQAPARVERARLPGDDSGAARPQAPAARKKSSGASALLAVLTWLCALALILAGVGAGAVIASVWLANRIGPTPGSFADLRAGVGAFFARYGVPEAVGFWLAAALVLAACAALAFVIFARPRKRTKSAKEADTPSQAEAARPETPAAAPPPNAVFISYARANAGVVMPICDAVEKEGGALWLDKEGIDVGADWAAEIVRAIKNVKSVAVMCSAAAFESDHVRREVHLADKYKKPLVPAFIENTPPPEAFEYFFAGLQHLNLHEIPEAERGHALARALKGV